ncbi:MAG TPA: MG2 domain-containing protein, partial [Phenylobacterium sp.]
MARQLSSTAVLGVAAAAFAAGLLTAAVISVGPHARSAQAEAASGGPWSLFGKPRAADAARPAAPKPEGFAVWRTRIDTSGPEPRACIEFSRALDPARNYGDFVNVSPDVGGKPGVSARGSELCLAGLGFLDRKVTLLKGLPALSGETLADNAETSFAFGDKPPYVGFAGGGVILPREESDGVGIETVNVSRVAVEVWRVADRNLVRKQISAPDATGEGEYASDYGNDSQGNEGRLIWEGQIAVKGDPGQRTTTVFPLGAVLKDMKPGGYLIKVKDASGVRGLKSGRKKKHTAGGDGEEEDGGYDPNPPAQARRWVMFTDMALTAYQGSDGLDVVVRSLNSAKVLPDLRVALVAVSGEDLAVGRTDAQGRLRFDKPLLEGDAGDKARMVMAYGPQGDLAVLDLDRAPVDLSSQGVGGRVAGKPDARAVKGAVDAYLYADRGIYRPGETAHVNALLRDHDTRAVKDRKGFIVVHRPSGTEFARYRFDKTPLGSIAADVVLPKTAPRGQWKVALELDGVDEPAGSLALDVEDFAPQRLAVTLQGREAVPLTGTETRVIDVNSRFLYGAPGAGLQTQAEARLKADTDPFPQFKGYAWGDQKTPFEEKFLDLDRTVTDAEGRAAVHLSSFAGQGVPQPLEAAMTASVFEPGGRPVREQLKFKVRTQPLYLGVKAEVGDAVWPNQPLVSLDVIAADAFGRRVAAPGVGYTLVSEAWTWDWFKQNDRWQWRRSSRDIVVQRGVLNAGAGAPARLARRLGWGDYRLELAGPQGAKSVIRFAAGWGEPAKDVEAPDVARVSAGTRAYRQGDTVEIKLKAPYAGEAQVAIATDRLIDFKTVSVGKDGASVRFKSNPAWGGGAYVLVSIIQPRNPATNPKPRRALGVIYVPLNAAGRTLAVTVGTPAKAASKKGLDVPLTITGESFHGKARVTLAAVDEGILQ